MIVNVSYKLAGLHEAARFIWENNSSVPNWPSKPKDVLDIIRSIQEMLYRGVKDNAKIIMKEKTVKAELNDEWCTFNGTGGYYVLYELIDSTDEEITIGVDILVDPAVAHPHPGFVTEFVDEIEDTV